MGEIIPAVLATSVPDLGDKISQLPDGVKFVHIDVLEEDVWANINIDFEVHLMVKNPKEIIDRWIDRGAKRIIVHTIENIIAQSVKIGLAVELNVPIEKIFPLMSQIDFIHLMSIAQIGAQGRPLDERIFDRIKMVKEKFPRLPISVDGGINTTNYQALKNSGADRLIVGSGFKDLWESLTKK
ncbi:MAG: Ribulose-phosphate 3-epimerase [Candidatus Azambacteria bacterium GW2011_GWF1_41_10]|nr:MAG: Ribulose-phosphate 3-epimerase [Candidatus Azambacteria bacterium GW2011_GWF1_41_10]KKT14398.1 MAG: Ribulose-phosphate 3-epimerase [Parcubacteria group bacterium GW2011_GWC1_43_30]KKT78928.1 MAG: Ribulose-phosphate 3-epimerase [Parcubacteria group bacterium GW2011_GWF2_44_8b]